jgi:hypothetical protein
MSLFLFLFVCSFELHYIPFFFFFFPSGVQIFFHSPVGFINSFNIVGGNLENSVMQNCEYYVVNDRIYFQ